jgi:hypothetical protein
MAVKRINTNETTYNKIKEFLPKVKGKHHVDKITIDEMYSIAREADYPMPARMRCSGCENSNILVYLNAYIYQFEHKDELNG